MLLKKSPDGVGSNSDCKISKVYCAIVESEKFKQPKITAEENQQFIKIKMKDVGFPSCLAEFFVKGIPKLKR